MIEVLVAVIIVVAGSFVQTGIGFGLAVIAAPLLFFIDPNYVPAPITVADPPPPVASAWAIAACDHGWAAP